MGLTAGIVGLPNVGKSTLFNAITHASVEAANYPFATINPNVGVVEVHDYRVDILKEIFHPKKTIYTTFEFTDIAGLVRGASKGEGLGNQFLSNIREVDAICHVVRCFENPDIEHVEGRVDPLADIEIIELELILADLQVVENRIEKTARKAAMKDKEAKEEHDVLVKIQAILLANKPIRSLELTEQEQQLIRGYHFITQKPVIYVANIDESDISDPAANPFYMEVKNYADHFDCDAIAISARAEEELSTLEDAERTEFLKELGVEVSGLDQIVHASYHLLNLCTYFTAGEDEVRAWTFVKGMKAPQCAGIIHTDFERGFIRAETYSYKDIETYRTEAAIKEAGKLRSEGKEYIVQDGDVMHFRFNV